ncbi:MAG: hypothetical protein PF569_06385 [Candidatus Woesearchaeota archaeon]|jgi:hypothetical protein|nr:hypothetical protein [Candidatus Woesearchaeota archaeon]
MYEIHLQTQEFIKELAKQEINEYTNNKINQEENIFKVEFKEEKDMIEFCYNIIYYSRTVEKIFLIKDKEKIDLTNFNLTKRDYKLNKSKYKLSPLIVNYALYLLNINKEKELSIIDPIANIGDIIIETSLFYPRKALNVKHRHELPIYKELRKSIIPKSTIDKNKYIGVLQENKEFKLIKENITYSGQKIKLSQYELDWLDVKFKSKSIDYVFSFFNKLNDEMQREFFYQSEFISKKKICVISNEEINKNYLKKYKLKIEHEETIHYENKNYLIYIISRNTLLRRTKIVKKNID